MDKAKKAEKKVLAVEVRNISGRKVKKLRQQGILPGNVFGKDVKSLAIQVNAKEFEKVYKEAGETGLIELQLKDETRPVLVHNLQLNAKSDLPLHVDFLQVNLKVKVEADVPVALIGESPAVKQGIGTVVQQLNEITVEALPGDLPEEFEVSVESLFEVDQAIYVKDIDYDKSKIEIKGDLEAIIAKVEAPQKEEVVEVTPVVAVGAEGEVAPEGEAPVEGVETPKEEPQK